MAIKYVFADEAGNFDFSRTTGASRYFILTTITMDNCAVGDALAELRRELTWAGHDVSNGFHAKNDTHAVRSTVYDTLAKHDFRVDAVVLDKAKAQPQTHTSEPMFYKYAWFYHFKYVAPKIVTAKDELFVVGASIETKRKREIFHGAIEDVCAQVAPVARFQTAFWPAAGEPCLQVADYCCWAIQRNWERGDDTWFKLIQSKVRSNYDLWRRGTTTYY